MFDFMGLVDEVDIRSARRSSPPPASRWLSFAQKKPLEGSGVPGIPYCPIERALWMIGLCEDSAPCRSVDARVEKVDVELTLTGGHGCHALMEGNAQDTACWR